jgi:subtilisin family serine protease
MVEQLREGKLLKKFSTAVLAAALLATSLTTAAFAVPNETAYTAHNIQQIWAKGFRGEGVTVAVIDQGVNLTHEYFAGQIVDGICVYQNTSPNLCPNGTKNQTGIQAASQRFDRGVLVTSENHGNMVAGLIAGKPNDQAPGGVAPNAKILMANTDLNLASLVTALNYIYDNREKYNIVAVSMSFGVTGGNNREFILNCNSNPDYAQLKATLAKLRSVGIMPFAASGNGFILNEVTPSAPTCLSEVVTVGALDARNQVSVYSTMNSKVELLGTDYAKSATTVGYQTAGGTSAATPVVAASYALLRQAFPTASAQVVLDAMKQTGRMVDDIVRKQIPVVDLVAAYNALAGSTVIPSPTASPVVTPRISFTTTRANLVISIRGYEGQMFAAKIGNTWVVNPVLKNTTGLSFTKIVRKATSNTTVKYEAYINGKRVAVGSIRIR